MAASSIPHDKDVKVLAHTILLKEQKFRYEWLQQPPVTKEFGKIFINQFIPEIKPPDHFDSFHLKRVLLAGHCLALQKLNSKVDLGE